MVRFMHSADWQVGMTRRWLQGDAQARFTAARIDAVRRMGRLAAEQGCEFLLVAGDVFESNQLRRQTVLRALEVLREVPVPVYLLPGNHDPLDAVTVYRQRTFLDACPAHVHVLDRAGPYAVRPGLELVAAPWHGKHPDRDLVADALETVGPADGTLRVVVGHGIVDVLDPGRDRAAAIATGPLEQALAKGRIHYVALGDRHSRTQVGESGAIWYSGACEVTDPREDTPGDVLVVEVEHGRAPEVSAHHVGTWAFRVLRRDLSGSSDVRSLDAELRALPDKDRTVITLALRGTLTVEEFAELTDVTEHHAALLAGLRDWDRHTDLVVLAGEDDLDDHGLGGFVAAAARDIRTLATAGAAPRQGSAQVEAQQERQAERAPSSSSQAWEHWRYDALRDDDAESARDALALLYRLTREDVR
jgi:DNA repair exonuclease SbcCD nuclease subunit